MADVIRTPRILTGIDSRSWEHPADRAALNALRRVPGFDEVLRKVFGFFGERPIRLAFQANAVRVSATQFPRVHELYREAARVLDPPGEYPLYVTQTPLVNAGAWGMEKPFITVNSGTLGLLTDTELKFILGHELGHIMSGHALYRTMMYILLQLANLGFPIVGLAARAVLTALMEWYRKAELSCDRAGLLAVQDPEAAMTTMLKFAGGGTNAQTNLAEFIQQADEYRQSGDLADQVFKVLNTLDLTHPFPVIRVAEMRSWFESGDYDRILRGEYRRRGDPESSSSYRDDLAAAAQSYRESARETFGQAAESARRVVDSFRTGFKRR
ncbi:MAG TPA: M48 family metallopeptidase [Longimicrobiaceae bacterium]|nr:M48 family metallopeptidase [Longimicrobiaceae bacterium]